MRRLEGLLATVRVDVNVPGAEVWLRDRQVGEAPGIVLVPGGRHVLEVRAPGFAPERRDVQLAVGTETTQRFTLRAYGRDGLDPVYFWSAAAAALVATLTATGLGTAALAQRGVLDAQLSDPVRMWAVRPEHAAEIQSLALAADLFFGSAALFAAGALVLALLTDFEGRARSEPALVVLPREGGAEIGAALRW